MKKKDVIDYYGSQSKAARALRIHRSTISNWPDDVPPLTAYRIERMTKGKLKFLDPWLEEIELSTQHKLRQEQCQ
ncbi:Cro/CI family transcriptional regulator [Parasalinivibrio latis]|uniref:Cro/CI family transcriptional regulator n=1 Tax=Parasalinivibrio latis TaxID=2952610 RepID=UPI0009E70A47